MTTAKLSTKCLGYPRCKVNLGMSPVVQGHSPECPLYKGTTAKLSPERVEVPLTRGKIAIVDAEDYERVSAFRWHARRDRNTWYARGTILLPDGTKRQESMHRFILGVTDAEIDVDHEDRDGLHNWRSNLRPCTPSQNQANSRKRVKGTSKFRGVYWNKKERRWYARIRVKGVRPMLGIFVSEKDAALAYDAAARQHFGKFAYLNFPDVGENAIDWQLRTEEAERQLAKVRQELADSRANHIDANERNMKAEGKLRSRDEAVRELLDVVRVAQAVTDCTCTGAKCKYLGGQIVAAAERLDKIVGQEGKR